MWRFDFTYWINTEAAAANQSQAIEAVLNGTGNWKATPLSQYRQTYDISPKRYRNLPPTIGPVVRWLSGEGWGKNRKLNFAFASVLTPSILTMDSRKIFRSKASKVTFAYIAVWHQVSSSLRMMMMMVNNSKEVLFCFKNLCSGLQTEPAAKGLMMEKLTQSLGMLFVGCLVAHKVDLRCTNFDLLLCSLDSVKSCLTIDLESLTFYSFLLMGFLGISFISIHLTFFSHSRKNKHKKLIAQILSGTLNSLCTYPTCKH